VSVKKGEAEKAGPKKDKKAEDKAKDEENAKASKEPLRIDLDGIKSRIMRLPVEVARYGNLASVKDTLYYMKMGDKDRKQSFKMYDLKAQKETDQTF